MASHKNPLNLDPEFEQWASATAINTSNWTFSGTNATQIQLDRQHARDHPERARFPSAQKSSDYIYKGRYSHRSTITTALGSFTLTSSEFAVAPGIMWPSTLLVCRRVQGLTLTARIVLAPTSAGTDNASLNTASSVPLFNPVPRHFFWDTTATRDLNLGVEGRASNIWTPVGIQSPAIPAGGNWMQVRIEVTDVSADIPAYFDVGEFSVVGQGTVIHGVG